MTTHEGAVRVLAGLLEARTGQQLSPSRQWRFEATLKQLMRERGFADLGELVARLASSSDPPLADAVVDALLNNETSFFRDALSFRLLHEALLDRLREAAPSRRRLRIWCAGCSTGQEAWSLAIMGEELAAALPGTQLDVLATDISAAAIAQAKRGIYSQFEVQRGLPVRSLLRWFEQEGEEWRVARSLRRMVRFERAGLATPPAAASFDFILCRNVLLYFAADQRRRLFDVLADALAPDGKLMLGAGETVLAQTERFVPDPDYRGLYLRRESDVGRLSA